MIITVGATTIYTWGWMARQILGRKIHLFEMAAEKSRTFFSWTLPKPGNQTRHDFLLTSRRVKRGKKPIIRAKNYLLSPKMKLADKK